MHVIIEEAEEHSPQEAVTHGQLSRTLEAPWEPLHRQKELRVIIKGVGGYLPQRVVTNDQLSQTLETSHEWIETRTGICQRHVSSEKETTAYLASQAARMALDKAGIQAHDLSLIILATSTPDDAIPATATMVQKALGALNAVAFDMNAACSGFIFALSLAESWLRQRGRGHALVIGAETMTRLVDWADRATAILFGDGGGAVVLSAEALEEERGLLAHCLYSDGAGRESLYASRKGKGLGTIEMKGREVFRHAVVELENATRALLKETGVGVEEIKWVVAHQANKRILEAVAEKLGIPFEKFIYKGNEHANTSAASIPLALFEADREGKIQKGDLMIMQAFGAGFTWGAYLVRA